MPNPDLVAAPAAWPHLPNAPIQEALLDVQIASAETVTADALQSMHDKIRALYPKMQKQEAWTASFEIGPAGVAAGKRDAGPVGYRFESTDGHCVFQANPGSFTFSRLRPYETWSAFRAEAQRLWDVYAATTKPIELKRIGLRYINYIEIPNSSFDIGDYLRIQPEIAPSLPQDISSFFMRLALPFDGDIQVMVTETSTAVGNGKCALILDIDAIKVSPTSVDDLWPKVEKARELKNRVFFATITDKAKGLCK